MCKSKMEYFRYCYNLLSGRGLWGVGSQAAVSMSVNLQADKRRTRGNNSLHQSNHRTPIPTYDEVLTYLWTMLVVSAPRMFLIVPIAIVATPRRFRAVTAGSTRQTIQCR